MTNKTKTITGVSVLGGVLIVLKLWHVAAAIDSVSGSDNHKFDNIPVTIITTDSSGKRDTMKMEEYLKKNKVAATDSMHINQ